MTLDPRLRSPKESTLFTLGAVFSGLCWLLLVVTVVGLLYAPFVIAAVLIAHALFLAHVRGNGLRVSPQQFPDLYARCEKAAKTLGLDEVPAIYVLQHGGVLNAFATKLLSRNFVIVLASLVEGCTDPRQLDFIIGHELGHIAAGHLRWAAFLAPFKLLPWAGPAYSRACEYTCDRVGMEVAGDLEQSQRGLVVLAAGGKLAAEADLEAFMSQSQDAGAFWMSVYELCSSHPFLCKRVAELQRLLTPGTVREVRRTPWAYPFAPLLGAGVGGGSSVVVLVAVWVGIMAAIAIPELKKYTDAARAVSAARAASAPEADALEEGSGTGGSDPAGR